MKGHAVMKALNGETNMKRFEQCMLVLVMAALLVGGHAWADDKEKTGASKAEAILQDQWTHKATDILGKAVMSKNGEKLGEVEDFAIGEGGEIRYVILSSGGLLGIGEEQHTIPWTAFRAGEGEDTLAANVTQEDIDKYSEQKGYRRAVVTSEKSQEKQAKEKDSNQKAQKEMEQKDQQKTAQTEGSEGGYTIKTERARGYIDKKVVGHDGRELGVASNLFISKQGKVTYVIVEDKDNQMHPVPIDMIQKDKSNDKLQASVDRSAFEQSPAFSAEELPKLAEGEWERKIRGYYE